MNNSKLLRFISCGRLAGLGFSALIFAATVGGMSFAVATEFNLQLVEGLVCPDESALTYNLGELETIDEFPSASNPIGTSTSARSFSLRCVDQGAVVTSGNGLLIRTLTTILGGYFLACFIPLLFASSLVFWIIRRKFRDPTVQ